MPFRARASPASLSRRRSAPIYIARWTAPSSPLPAIRAYGSLRDQSFFTSQPGPSKPTVAQIRYQSTSTSPLDAVTNFFSFGRRKRSDRPTPQTASKYYIRALEKGDSKKMIEAYQVMIGAVDLNPIPQRLAQTYLSPEDLIAGMNLLSISSTDEITMLRQMYSDITSRFGYTLEMAHHGAMGIGLSRAGRVGEALDLLRILDPEVVEWTELLRAAVDFDPNAVNRVRDTLKAVRPLTVEDYQLLALNIRRRISERRDSKGDLRALKKDLDDLREEMGELDKEIGIEGQSNLFRSYIHLGNLEEANRIARDWELRDVGYDANRWKALCDLARLRGDMERLGELCREMTENEDTPTGLTLYTLVQSEESRTGNWPTAVDQVETKLGIDLDHGIWSRIIYNYIESSQKRRQDFQQTFENAMTLYRSAKNHGVEVSARLAAAIIVPLCAEQHLRLKSAVGVYDDFMKSDIPISTDNDSAYLSRIYFHLMRACAYHKSPDAVRQSVILLEDMAKNGLAFSSPIIGIIISLIQLAPDHQTAFKVYTRYHALMSSTFDEKMYLRVMNAFLRRQSDQDIAPPEYVLEMMKHMYAGGIRPGSFVLTSLLHYYSQLAGAKPDDNMYRQQRRQESILRMIQELHTRIKLDPMINIDIPLLNSLMNAYNRIGQPKLALNEWNILVERRSREDPAVARIYYPASVSIALDVCGYNRLQKRADMIWTWAKRHGFTHSLKTWRDYVECLCRLGLLDRAIQTVFVEMKEQKAGAPLPDINIVRIVAKFSVNISNGQNVVVARVQENFPEWAEDIQSVLRLPKDKFDLACEVWGKEAINATKESETTSRSFNGGEGTSASIGEIGGSNVFEELQGILEQEKAKLEGGHSDPAAIEEEGNKENDVFKLDGNEVPIETGEDDVKVSETDAMGRQGHDMSEGYTGQTDAIADEIQRILAEERTKLEANERR